MRGSEKGSNQTERATHIYATANPCPQYDSKVSSNMQSGSPFHVPSASFRLNDFRVTALFYEVKTHGPVFDRMGSLHGVDETRRYSYFIGIAILAIH